MWSRRGREFRRRQAIKLERDKGMTTKDLAGVVNRAFALLLAAWALVEGTYFPERVFSLLHHLSERSVLNSHDYWSRYYSIVLIFYVVRVAALLIAAIWFWKRGLPSEALMPKPSQESDTSK
jgi:hypothetical protein